jgi:hypothetical protein
VASKAERPSLGRPELGRGAGDPAIARSILAEGSLRPYLEELGLKAEEARAREVPSLPFSSFRLFDETGDRSAFEASYFERRRDLVALALAAWLWKRPADIAALEDEAWAICDEYSWALPAHLGGTSLDPAYLPFSDSASEARVSHPEFLDLFACETAFALAEILSLLEGSLTPIVAERARREVERRVLGPFLARREPWPWELMRNNWCAVCAGSVGAAALYLVRDEARQSAILERVLPTLDRFLESFADDGACLEGLGYWTYGVGFFVAFAQLLSDCSGGAIDLMAREKFRRISAFQAKAYLNDSVALSFADGSIDERFRIGLTAFLARRFPESAVPSPALAASFGHDRYGRWCLAFRDLLWGGTETGGAPRPEGLGRAWLPDAQWLICPAPAAGALAFAAKGGHNDEPHNHNDVGSFELVLGKRMLMADLGKGEYTRDYFNENRYSVFCNSSLSHNLPIIDGRGQEAGASRGARGVEFRGEVGRARLKLDIAAAYDCGALLSLGRSFDFDGSSLLVLKDEYEFARAGFEVTERFVTLLPLRSIAAAEDGSLVVDADGSLLTLSCSLPGCSPVLSTHPHRAHDGRETEVVCIDFALPREAAAFSVSFEFRLR